MGKRGPKAGVTDYAVSLGLTREQLRRIGGMERVMVMSADARAVMLSDIAKRRGTRPDASSRFVEVKR